MHLLLFMDHNSKAKEPADVDEIISAEFPDPIIEPELHQLVLHNMTHGPCDYHCQVNQKCTKGFPKPFREVTSMDWNAYVCYCRCDTGRTFQCNPDQPNDAKYDNQWVVPYNHAFLKCYQYHINVECCASIKSVKYIHKYIYKYIYKGHDWATMHFEDTQDEIQIHLDSRYISAPEAFWRLQEFKMHAEVPNIVRLQLHLEGEHSITFRENNSLEEVQNRAETSTSTLLAYFKECLDNPDARQYLYQEFPQHFVWIKNQKLWKPRQKGFAIGRIYYAPPKSGEKFYLQTLLITVRGPTSLKDLRTVDGVEYATFKEACNALRLLENDGECFECLCEASVMQTGTQLCRLFVTILKDCLPTEPATLWDQYKVNICDDLQY